MTAAMEFGRLSQWRDTGSLGEAKARELAARLELRARAEDETAAREEYLRLLGVVPGERVLDVGCGSGVVTRAIAQRVAPDGRAVGIDPSRALLTVAREYADAAGLGGLIELREGDCRSGGRVGVFDFDGDSLVIAHPDRELTRRIVLAQSDHSAVNGGLARQLPGLLTELGLIDVRVKAFMPLEREPGSFYAGLAVRAAEVAAQVGAITSDELAGWLAAFRVVLATGHFLGGRLHIFAWGARPVS